MVESPRDGVRKEAEESERGGVGECWIADPEAKQVTVLKRSPKERGFVAAATFTLAHRVVLDSPLLPGLRIPFARIVR